MSDVKLNLESDLNRLTVETCKEYPCFGLCGKSWDESYGGWMEFEESGDGVSLAPRWFCSECSYKRSAGESVRKSDSLDS